MNNDVTRQYQHLTAKERFRLVLAASDREDDAEITRLTESGGQVCRIVSDHALYARAFVAVAKVAFIDLVEQAAGFRDLLDFAAKQVVGDCDDDDGPPEHWRHVMFAGYWLRTKWFGWELFCQRIGVPPLGLWRDLPGFDRLEGTIAQSERMSYTAAGAVRTMNRERPKGATKMTRCPLTPKAIAREYRMMYRMMLPSDVDG